MDIELEFWISICPHKNHLPNHIVGVASLSIICKAPVITSQSPPRMSWPFSFVIDGVPMSLKEVEEMFQVSISMGCQVDLYEMWRYDAGFPTYTWIECYVWFWSCSGWSRHMQLFQFISFWNIWWRQHQFGQPCCHWWVVLSLTIKIAYDWT